jgi:fucose permease
MPGTFYRNRFTWLAYLLLAFYSYFVNVLGPITPFLKDELGLSYTISSLHFSAFAVGILGVGVFGHLIINRIGRRWSLWTGAAGMGLGTFLLLVGRTPLITIAGSFCMGLVGSLILAIVPAALADQYGEAREVAISEANTVASLAGTISPLLVGWFARSLGDWRLALGIFAFLPIPFWFAFRTARPPQAPVSTETQRTRPPALPPRYWVYWADLVLVVSIEFCMIFWSADYLETGLGLQKADAATAVSLFLGAMIVGRFGVSRLVKNSAASKWVFVSLLTAGAGFFLFWRAASVPLALTGLFLTGLGVAGLYPLILSLAIEATGGYSIQGSARATLASGTAILLLPLVLGRLADSVGIRQAYGLVTLLLAAALLVTLAAERVGLGEKRALE